MKSTLFSIKMLLKDWKTSTYYLMMISIVSVTSFIFSNISYNENLRVEMEMNQFGRLIPRYSEFITMIVLGFSLFLVIYAYLYMLKSKSRELKLIKFVGNTPNKMISFLLSQNIVLLIIGSFLGLVIGFILNPLVNFIIYSFVKLDQSYLTFYWLSCIDSFKINMFTLLITTCLGIGYIYRNEVKELSIEKSDWTKDKRLIHFPTAFHIFLYLLGVVMFLTAEKETILLGAVCYSIIGCCGAFGLIRKKMCVVLKKRIDHKERIDKITYIAINRLIYTLKQNSLLILGLLFTSTAMMAWTVSSSDEPKEFIVSLISFVFSLLLLYSSVLSKFLSDFKVRKGNLLFLWKCGYTKEDINKILRYEILYFFLILCAFSILYILLMLMRFVGFQIISIVTATVLLFIYLIISFGATVLTILCISHNYKKLMRKVDD